MSETYTPRQEKNNDEEIDDNFATINGWEQKDAARLAQEMIDATTATQFDTSKEKNSWSTKAKVTAGIVVGAALGAGASGTIVADHLLPGQELATASSTVQQGEGVEQSVDRAIAQIESQKIDPADTTERQDVIYQAVDIHSDNKGIVQAGETIAVIAEKSPIFGDVTYKAVPNAESPIVDIQSPRPPAVNDSGTIPAPITH